MKRRALLLAVFALLPLACGRTAEEPVRAPKSVMLLEAIPVADVPKAPAADRTALVAGNDEFALDLYRQLSREQGNLFFSPCSLSAALAMTYAGARGDTAAEMAKTLHFGLDAEKLHPTFADLNRQLLGDQRGYQLSMANALWGQKDYSFEPAFMQRLKESYGAGLGTVDFERDTEAARRTINGWVSQQTRAKIPELLQAKDLSPLTRFVLTNAVYFQADWSHPFEKAATQDRPFWLNETKQVQHPLMHERGHFSYMEEDGLQVLELPYKSRISLIVLLPRERDGLAALEKKLTAKALRTWLGAMKHEEVVVALPRFKVQSAFSLKDTLAALGMPRAFSKEADFAGISSSARTEELKLTAVIHQAVVEVDEKGTEAAAASAVIGVKKEAMKEPSPPKQFQADHPFLFLIRDGHSSSILFLGRLTDPREK